MHEALLISVAGPDVAGWMTPANLIPVVAMALGLILIAWHVIEQRRKNAPPPAAPAIDADELRALARDVRALNDELARQTEARAQQLEALIEQADQRLAALRQASQPRTDHIEVKPARPAQAPATFAAPQHAPMDQRHGVVYSLADAGHSPAQIAKQTGIPTGQVELILGLRRIAREPA